MRKFLTLLTKEVRELLTPQMLVPFIIVMVVFNIFGKVSERESQKAQVPQPIVVIDQDETYASIQAVQSLQQGGFVVEQLKQTSEEAGQAVIRQNTKKILLVIPAGFADQAAAGKTPALRTYVVLDNFSTTGSRKYTAASNAVALINASESAFLLAQDGKTPEQIAALKQPITAQEFVMLNGKTTEISPLLLLGFVTSQTTFIPIILFLVIVFSSQMIATAIAAEKENKTLETLLSMPIDRRLIVAAKMIGAGVVALLLAGVYIYAFRSFMTGAGGYNSVSGEASAASTIKAAAEQLGLIITPLGYALLGISLFFGILNALAISMILGAFAEDVKSVQGLTTPLMVLVMIPYFASLLLDLSSVSPALRYSIYAIPFAHPFLAAPNLFLHNPIPVLYGILYQAIIFIFFVWLAAWLFGGDRILTLKLSFKRNK